MSIEEEMALVLENSQFFERVRQHLNDEITNLRFLELVNVFNQGIIGVKAIVNKAADFLQGDPSLLDQFKHLISYGATIHVPDDGIMTNGHTNPARINPKSGDIKRVRYHQ